jgi:hypothetical protein
MKKILLSINLLLIIQTVFAQETDRRSLRAKMKEDGGCKNVALTLTGGRVAFLKSSGWVASDVPSGLIDDLKEVDGTGKTLQEIVLTENGSWLVIYTDLRDKLSQWNDEGEEIISATFNDNGDWIAITKNKYSASEDEVYDMIDKGENEFGAFLSAHLTNDGMVLCFKRGYKYRGNVPERLKQKLRESKLDVIRVKFLSDGSYFFSDAIGNCGFNM